MASKTVKLNAEYRGFSISWETTNKKNRKHLMRHFLDISSASDIMDIAEALTWEPKEGASKAEKLAEAKEWLTESLQEAQVQDGDCEIPISKLPFKYVQLIHETQRSTDPFPSER